MSSNSIKINQYVTHYKEALRARKTIRNFHGFTPLKTGQRIPDFLQTPLVGPIGPSLAPFKTPFNEQQQSLDLFVNGRPTVLIFRPIFQSDGEAQKAFLSSLQTAIQVMGGSVFIITNAQIRDLGPSLGPHHARQVLSDPNNGIAESFGLYHPDNQISDWLSGIDGDVSLPAFYLINPNGVIGYHYVDYNFRTYQPGAYRSGQTFVRQLLNKVYQNAQKTSGPLRVAYGA